jgi:hypothetical protein
MPAQVPDDRGRIGADDAPLPVARSSGRPHPRQHTGLIEDAFARPAALGRMALVIGRARFSSPRDLRHHMWGADNRAAKRDTPQKIHIFWTGDPRIEPTDRKKSLGVNQGRLQWNPLAGESLHETVSVQGMPQRQQRIRRVPVDQFRVAVDPRCRAGRGRPADAATHRAPANRRHRENAGSDRARSRRRCCAPRCARADTCRSRARGPTAATRQPAAAHPSR